MACLRRCAGALMEYCVDFAPRMYTYCQHIRSPMPEAFSGFWARESVAERHAEAAWSEVAGASKIPEVAAANIKVKAAHQAYHRYHVGVMKTSVPDGRSLAQIYRKEHGCGHSVTERDMDVYDKIFRVVRSTSLSKLEFMRVACRTFLDTLSRISAGHRLSNAVVADIAEGFRVAVRVFGNWLGEVPEGSMYFGKQIRGE